MKSLRTRLMGSYALVALFSVLGVLFSANYLVDFQFKRMVQGRIAREQQEYRDSFTQAYSQSKGWNTNTLDLLGMEALSKGYIIKLTDTQGNKIWDARTHNEGLCTAMLTHMAMDMAGHYPGWNGRYEERDVPFSVEGNLSGTITFGLYGPIFFNDSELEFLQVLNTWVMYMGILALFLSLILGVFMSRWISRPILQVTQAAHGLRMGNWNVPALVNSNITEIKDLSQSIQLLGQNLHEQDSLRKRLTADVSHELRTPLCILQGKLEALIDGIIPTNPDQMENLRQEVLRLTRLVGQLETLTQAEAPSQDREMVTLESRKFLNSIKETFSAQALENNINLQVETEDFNFLGEADKIRQILFNLISNGIKYTPSGGSLTLLGKQENKSVIFQVTDTGIGISEKDLPFIFERFYRVDVSRTRSSGGVGLGLSIARSLAIALGGSLSVESTEGVGSNFELIIPEN